MCYYPCRIMSAPALFHAEIVNIKRLVGRGDHEALWGLFQIALD